MNDKKIRVYLKNVFDAGWIFGQGYYTDINNANTPEEYWDRLQRQEDRCIDDALEEVMAIVLQDRENVDKYVVTDVDRNVDI